jgi:hypothetical protein
MDSGAFNYNPLATADDSVTISNPDGACLYYGCMDDTADNFNPSAQLESLCHFYGCMDR